METISIVIPIFGTIGLGYLSRRFNVIKQSASSSFNRFVYFFALPFLILRGILNLTPESLLDWRLIATNLLAMTVLMVISIFVSSKILHRDKKTVAMFAIASYFGSVAYIGIPFNELAFGKTGGGIAVIIAVISILFAITIGLGTLKTVEQKKQNSLIDILQSVIQLPIIWATILGLIIVFLNIPLPASANSLMNSLAGLAGPLALFSLGMFVHENKVKGDFVSIFKLSIFSLLALPLVVFLIAKLFNLSGLPLQVSIIQAGMPIAVTNFVFSQKFKTEEEIISQAIVLTVLLSPITLSLLLWLVNK